MKKLFITISLLLLLTSCNETMEVNTVDYKLIHIDQESLILDEVYLIDSEIRITDFEDVQEREISELTIEFFDYAEENNANYYGPTFPNETVALLTFSNEEYSEIFVFISRSNDDVSTYRIGIEISDAVGFKEIHYVLDISKELYDLIHEYFEW